MMSKKNHDIFKGFCDYVLKNANDDQVEYLLAVIYEAVDYAAKESRKMMKQERSMHKSN